MLLCDSSFEEIPVSNIYEIKYVPIFSRSLEKRIEKFEDTMSIEGKTIREWKLTTSTSVEDMTTTMQEEMSGGVHAFSVCNIV